MLKWNSVKELMPGTGVGKVIVYFGSSGNMLLCNYSTDEKCMFSGGHVFTRHDFKGVPTKFVDFPTHWAFINVPEV